MKQPYQLVWRPDQEAEADASAYKQAVLLLDGDKTFPVRDGTHHTLCVRMEATSDVTPNSKFLLPTFISPAQRKLFWASAYAIFCAGIFIGIVLALFVNGSSGSGEDDAPAEDEPLTLPSNASDSCVLTYDPDDTSELIREAYVRTFFNLTCLATNGTGDPCDLHIAEEYKHRMFSALRFDRLVAEFLAFVAIFSLAQVGGIPRPTDRKGMVLWLVWMATQLAQYVVILCALLMQVCCLLGVRARLSPCLVRSGGTALLDFYALCTFALQPPLLVKAMMLFAYAFLLSLGMLVFDGSRQWPWGRKRVADRNPTQTLSLARTVPFTHPNA